jgi:ribosomal protein S8
MKFFNAPIHDLLIRIKNAYNARRTVVSGVIHSKFKIEILNLLKDYDFVKSYNIIED